MAVVDDGRKSVTHYNVVEAMPAACLAQVRLETDRDRKSVV